MVPKVYIVIVNWNGERDTIACLESLKHVRYEEAHVVISDNGSKPASLSALRSWINENLHAMPNNGIQSCVILENGQNLGFTGANTTGIHHSMGNGADYVLFLNNDTTVTPEFLTIMIQLAESDGTFGITGCKIFTDEKNVATGRHKIWSLGGYSWKRGIPINMGSGAFDSDKLCGTIENELINGCCMLIKRAVIEDIGVQDDALFFGMDDAEFSLRARRKGWKNVIALDAQIYHLGSHSVSAGSPLQAYYLFRNMPFFRLRYFPWYRNLVFFCNYTIRFVLIGGMGRILLGRGNKVNRGMWLGMHDFMTGRMGECKHSVLMKVH
jgi:GT2 family glycosyltransferase